MIETVVEFVEEIGVEVALIDLAVA